MNIFNKIQQGIGLGSLGKSYDNLSPEWRQGLSMGAGIAGTAVGGLLGGGYSSGVGSAFGTLGNMASVIPGPWGTVAGAGLNVLGGITNRLFGSKLNNENISNVQNNIDALNNFTSNASDYDTLESNILNAPGMTNFSNSYIGKDGLFSSKITNKANALRASLNQANQFKENTLNNNANNIAINQYQNALDAYNINAFGGPLNMSGSLMSPFGNRFDFGGDMTNDNSLEGITNIDNGGTHESNPYGGVQLGVDNNNVPNLVEEGEVVWNDYVFSNRLKVPKSVKEKNKLKGKKSLSYAEAAKKLQEENKERPSDPISKRGLNAMLSRLAEAQELQKAKQLAKQEAKNSASRNLLASAQAQQPTEPYNTQQAPVESSQQYMDIENTEGSNDMYAYGGPMNIFKNGGKKTNKGKISSTISQDIKNWINTLYTRQLAKGSPRQFYKELLNAVYDTGTLDNQHNPVNTIPKEVLNNSDAFIEKITNNSALYNKVLAMRGTPLLGSDGKQVFTKDSSGRLIPQYNSPKGLSLSIAGTTVSYPNYLDTNNVYQSLSHPDYTPFSDGDTKISASQYFNKKHPDPGLSTFYNPTKLGMSSNKEAKDALIELAKNQVQNSSEYENELDRIERLPDYTLNIPTNKVSTSRAVQNNLLQQKQSMNNGSNWLTNLRYAPVVGSAWQVMSDLSGLTNTPDYTNANIAMEASRGIPNVTFNPIGGYVKPLVSDRDRLLNAVNASTAATRRAIMNTSGGNRGTALASLLANDYTANNQIGQSIAQMDDTNYKNYLQAAEFNNKINQYNSTGFLDASKANSNIFQARAAGALESAKLRDAIDARIGTAKSANLTNFFDSLGNIGREEFARNMVNTNKGMYYQIGRDGTVMFGASPVKAFGGYLTIKNKNKRKKK